MEVKNKVKILSVCALITVLLVGFAFSVDAAKSDCENLGW